MNGFNEQTEGTPNKIPGQNSDSLEAPVSVKSYINTNRKLLVYMVFAFRMKNGASPSLISATIKRLDKTMLPRESDLIREFAAELSIALQDVFAMAISPAEPPGSDEPGFLYRVAESVFGEESLHFLERISLDVSAAEVVKQTRGSGDIEKELNKIVAEILKNTAELLKSTIDQKK